MGDCTVLHYLHVLFPHTRWKKRPQAREVVLSIFIIAQSK